MEILKFVYQFEFVVWNIRTNSPWSVMTLVGHSGTIRCLHLLGNRLVSGSTDQTLKLWDLKQNQDQWSSIACRVTMIGHTDTVRCVQVILSHRSYVLFDLFYLLHSTINRWTQKKLLAVLTMGP